MSKPQRQPSGSEPLLAGQFAMLLGACFLVSCGSASPAKVDAQDPAYAGWYLQREGARRFTPCGRKASLDITAAADLATRAQRFGLQDDMPVYVKLRGRITAGRIAVSEVEQFGSPIPIRDCPLEGVVIPSPRP